jgi:hypothetical protein
VAGTFTAVTTDFLLEAELHCELIKDFNFVIAKNLVTTEITEFREIWPKFRQIFLEIRT